MCFLFNSSYQDSVTTPAHDTSAIDATTTTTSDETHGATDKNTTAVVDTAADDDATTEVQSVEVDAGDSPSVEDDLPPG
jgi:hypothetical protein